ncbi:GntR family transcriptional regulator [Pelosinus sp. sgz500959]|uniref:GntR family transcriptional regulator n=1 Tax=Pelosinus sp. sgz500959 TaxID=3242472 RepID=UPI00367243FF
MDHLMISEQISEVKQLRDIIFEHLRQEILDGHLKPDDRLIERDIATKLNVSRTPIREALRKLESEGFVEHVPRKGVIVRGFNMTEIEEIYDIRKELECLVVRKAISKITNEDIQMLKRILEGLETEETMDQLQSTAKGLDQFDEVILNMTQMPLLKNFVYNLKESLIRYRRINLSNAPRRKSAICEHKAILQAIINRDVPQAERLTIEHIDHARDELLKKCQLYK